MTEFDIKEFGRRSESCAAAVRLHQGVEAAREIYQSQLLRRLIEMAERMARQAEMEASDE